MKKKRHAHGVSIRRRKPTAARKPATTPARSKAKRYYEPEEGYATYDNLDGSLYPASDYERKYKT